MHDVCCCGYYYPQQQTPCTVSPSAIGTTFVTQQTRGKNPTHTHISPTHSNVRAYDVGLVLSSPTRTKSPDLSELLRSLIISRAFPPISSIVLPVPYAKKYTSVKRAADWVIVSANTLGMLRLTIKTLLNQSRDISTSLTILKNTWRFVVFPSI